MEYPLVIVVWRERVIRDHKCPGGGATTTTQHPGGDVAWYALSAQDVTAQLGVHADEGLTAAEVERRLAQYGANELPTEPPPSVWVVARGQLANPMNIMLLMVCGSTELKAVPAGT